METGPGPSLTRMASVRVILTCGTPTVAAPMEVDMCEWWRVCSPIRSRTVGLILLGFFVGTGSTASLHKVSAAPARISAPLTVIDGRGEKILSIDADREGGVLQLFGRDGAAAAVLDCTSEGGRLRLFRNGEVSATLGSQVHGGFYELYDTAGRPVHGCFANRQGCAGYFATPGKMNMLAVSADHKEVRALVIRRNAAQISLEGSDAGGTMQVLGRENRVIFSVPPGRAASRGW